VTGIDEQVHSWDKTFASLRQSLETLETAFKRVQLQLMHADSMGVGGGLAAAVADDDDDMANNNPLYQQSVARRPSLPNLSQVPFDDAQRAAPTPYDAEAALGN
jgi:hypothetical protein